MHPSILMLDEPAAGLSSAESEELAVVVRRLAEEWGIAVLVVEHDMNFVMGVCDEVVVLDFGKKIAHGAPHEVRNDPAVIAAYLGDELDDEDQDDDDPEDTDTNGASATADLTEPETSAIAGGGAA